ncbi:MAG: hypothetical protein LBE09_05520 [Christensenellaceae bacterium]|jgi:hypothetical protein|nr:hypothetical protein [Christensenellaceae bacterium]
MANEIKITQSDKYAAGIFFYAAIPLLKVICESEPKYGNKFKGKSFVFQISAACEDAKGGKMATHFTVENGVWTTHAGEVHEKPDIEFAFPNLRNFAIFFSGKGMPLPKIVGMFKHFGLFTGILGALLRMSKLMQAKDKPTNLADQIMLCKLYLYLLPNGMSRLNKMGHPDIKVVTDSSPDRAYALIIEGYPELQSWLRIKAGKSMSGRGEYKRCKPFLAMKFKNPSLALDILMSKADMVEYIREGNLFIDGAPEFGGTIGGLMFKVAYYAQGTYLDVEK